MNTCTTFVKGSAGFIPRMRHNYIHVARLISHIDIEPITIIYHAYFNKQTTHKIRAKVQHGCIMKSVSYYLKI